MNKLWIMKNHRNIKRHTQVILFLIIALLATNSRGDETPLPIFIAEYKAKIKGFDVEAARFIKPLKNNRFELIFKAESLLASMEETSRFHLHEGKLIPDYYQFNQSVLGKGSERNMQFDHEENRIISTMNGKTKELSIDSRVWDPLNYQLQLQMDLSSGNDSFTYQVANKKKIKEHHFVVVGEEKLNTAIGELNTIKVELRHKTNKRKTYIWLAKNWNHLLVRFEQWEKGKKEFVISLSNAIVNNQIVKGK